MGLSVGTIIRIVALISFSYTWYIDVNAQLPERFDFRLRYGSYWRYLTKLNFLLLIAVNFLLIIGEVLPKGRLTSNKLFVGY